jgi:hypothetical protein
MEHIERIQEDKSKSVGALEAYRFVLRSISRALEMDDDDLRKAILVVEDLVKLKLEESLNDSDTIVLIKKEE